MPNSNPGAHDQYTDGSLASHSDETTQTADSQTSHTGSARVDSSPARTHTPAKRGFAAMDEAMQRTIASKGGQSQGKANNPGNFANNRERAREAGRKGGEAHGHRANAAHANQQTHHS